MVIFSPGLSHYWPHAARYLATKNNIKYAHAPNRPLITAALAYQDVGRAAPAMTACATENKDPAATFPIFDCHIAAQDPSVTCQIIFSMSIAWKCTLDNATRVETDTSEHHSGRYRRNDGAQHNTPAHRDKQCRHRDSGRNASGSWCGEGCI